MLLFPRLEIFLLRTSTIYICLIAVVANNLASSQALHSTALEELKEYPGVFCQLMAKQPPFPFSLLSPTPLPLFSSSLFLSMIRTPQTLKMHSHSFLPSFLHPSIHPFLL